jgi:radical SAM protein (TIGR01212 family)
MPEKGFYNDYGAFLKKHFPFKVQKVTVNAGFTCPNRDGSIGRGGCTYCDNRSFNPTYCDAQLSVSRQLEEGKDFFGKKYPDMKYLAYFQAYTNTYGTTAHLHDLYEEALVVPDVVGLIVGTRPDCLPEETLDYLEALAKRTFVVVEIGIESTSDVTLRRINRGHTFEQTRRAVEALAERGIMVGGHVILGLPGETRADWSEQAQTISALPLTTLKIHQLQLMRGTAMAKEYEAHPEDFKLFALDDYIDCVIDYIERLRDDLVLERFVSQAPKSLLIAPDWGLKNYEFTAKIKRRMVECGAWQGRLFVNN